MPHFILECSPAIFRKHDPDMILRLVYETAMETNIFNPRDIKVRIRTDEHFLTGGEQEDYLHVFSWIMSGRTTQQKKTLSDAIVRALEPLYPGLRFIAMNVAEFDKDTYTNLRML